MKRLLTCATLGAVLLMTAACMSSGSSDTQSGGSTATAEMEERGVPTLPAE